MRWVRLALLMFMLLFLGVIILHVVGREQADLFSRWAVGVIAFIVSAYLLFHDAFVTLYRDFDWFSPVKLTWRLAMVMVHKEKEL